MPRKRTVNRMDNRGDYEEEGGEPKAEAEEKDEDEEEGDDEEDAEADAEAEPDADAEEGGDDDEDAPKKVKKPKKKAAAAPKRTRAPKVVRMKAVWVVLDNSSKLLETFEFSQKAEAEAYLEQKNIDKKGTCYLQMHKVPWEDKEAKEK